MAVLNHCAKVKCINFNVYFIHEETETRKIKLLTNTQIVSHNLLTPKLIFNLIHYIYHLYLLLRCPLRKG